MPVSDCRFHHAGISSHANAECHRKLVFSGKNPKELNRNTTFSECWGLLQRKKQLSILDGERKDITLQPFFSYHHHIRPAAQSSRL